MVLASLSPALGPLLVAGLLLVAAGLAKLDRSAPTALALARAGLRVPDGAVRALGVVEVAAGLAAGGLGGPAGIVVAALYLGFACFTARQVLQARGGEAADCGCFGEAAAPVGWTHVVVNVLLAAGAVAAVVVGADGVAAATGDQPVATLAVLGLAAVAAAGVRALLTDLPAVRALLGPAPGSSKP
ncbi:MAG TPA: MauE/DoxX family redox-associated membrane protein [Iamia sp.]|nr:MauE/DoxX family redox-associated membrane protein [Iamia sp.]